MPAQTKQRAASRGDHIAQFYGRDEELVSAVSWYLGEGLEAGEATIMIATAAHRAAVRDAMAANHEIAAARARGNLIMLDAAEMMDLLMADGHPDRESFGAVVGGLIRQATAAGRPVRVYGEIVALLWDAGQVSAALELERFCNELDTGLPCSLWCGYPSRSVSDAGHAAGLRELYGLHTSVVGIPAIPPRPRPEGPHKPPPMSV
jgi:hypothetical protein